MLKNIQEQQTKNSYWRYDADLFTHMAPEIFTAEYWKQQNAIIGQAQGRGTTWFFKHNGANLVLKHYQRGGLLGKVNRDLYLFSSWKKTRASEEFLILEHMINSGLPVPRPAAIQIFKTGQLYRADLITHLIPGARDLCQILTSETIPSETYARIGEVIRQFHRAGIYHSDLNIHNILIDEQEKIWIIDFDKAKKCIPDEHRNRKVLDRLKRSFEKEKERVGAKIDGYEEALT